MPRKKNQPSIFDQRDKHGEDHGLPVDYTQQQLVVPKQDLVTTDNWRKQHTQGMPAAAPLPYLGAGAYASNAGMSHDGRINEPVNIKQDNTGMPVPSQHRSLEALFQVTHSELESMSRQSDGSPIRKPGPQPIRINQDIARHPDMGKQSAVIHHGHRDDGDRQMGVQSMGDGVPLAPRPANVMPISSQGGMQHQVMASNEPRILAKMPSSEPGASSQAQMEEQGMKLVYTKQGSWSGPTSMMGSSTSGQGSTIINVTGANAAAVQGGLRVVQAGMSPGQPVPTRNILLLPAPIGGIPHVQVGRKRKHPQKPGKHICQFCGRGCQKPSVLEKHLRAHTGERPYPCILCGFSFKTKSNLYKHCKSRSHVLKMGEAKLDDQGNPIIENNMEITENETDETFLALTPGDDDSMQSDCDGDDDGDTVQSNNSDGSKVVQNRHFNNMILPEPTKQEEPETSKATINKDIPFHDCHMNQTASYVVSPKDESSDNVVQTQYQCSQCEKSFKYHSLLRQHMKSHVRRRYICINCNKSCHTWLSLQKHLRTHTKSQNTYTPRAYTCTQCQKEFPSTKELDKHLQYHSGDYGYACKICEKAYSTVHSYGYHMKTAHGYYTCTQCAKGFSIENELKMHLRYHSGNYEYACNICEKAYSHVGPYSSHMKTIHDKTVNCNTDDYKTFNCTQCPKVCLYVGELKMHVRYHSGDYKYACHSCEKAYSDDSTGSGCHSAAYNYTSHMKKIHDKHVNTQCKTYTCTYCPKELTSPREFRLHLQYHSGDSKYVCKDCQLGYKTFSPFEQHMKTHHDEVVEPDKHPCTQCTKKFRNAADLRMHLLYHSGNYEYLCKCCLMGYAKLKGFRTHMRNQHDETPDLVLEQHLE